MEWFTSIFKSTQPTPPVATEAQLTNTDAVLIAVIAVFVSAIAIVGIQILFTSIVATFRGFQKFLEYVYLTYTFIWRIAIFLLQLLLFFLVLVILYYWFVEEKTRHAIAKQISDAAPKASQILQNTKAQLILLNQYKDAYLKMKNSSP